MKTAKQAQRDARQLFRLCLVDGSLDEDRARRVVRRLVDAGRPGALPVLSRFQRLVRLDRDETQRRCDKRCAVAPGHPRACSKRVSRACMVRGSSPSFAEDPALLGGVRVTVGSDVYDGSGQGRPGGAGGALLSTGLAVSGEVHAWPT